MSPGGLAVGPLGLRTHPGVIFLLAGGVMGERSWKLMKLYPPTPTKMVNQTQCHIREQYGEDVMPP